jgi:hypothetical protein
LAVSMSAFNFVFGGTSYASPHSIVAARKVA